MAMSELQRLSGREGGLAPALSCCSTPLCIKSFQLLIIGRHLHEFVDDAWKYFQRLIDFLFSVVATERKSDRSLCGSVRHIHRAQRWRRFVRGGMTGRTGRDTNTGLIELDQNIFA